MNFIRDEVGNLISIKLLRSDLQAVKQRLYVPMAA